MTRELKGRHVLIIALSAFALILTANMAMLFAATGSFPGLVVKNSYVAGVGWNERAAAQQALGWQTEIGFADGMLTVALTDAEGKPVTGQALVATVGRPSSDTEDRQVVLSAGPDGYSARMNLAPGAWRIETATRTEPPFRYVSQIFVADAN